MRSYVLYARGDVGVIIRTRSTRGDLSRILDSFFYGILHKFESFFFFFYARFKTLIKLRFRKVSNCFVLFSYARYLIIIKVFRFRFCFLTLPITFKLIIRGVYLFLFLFIHLYFGNVDIRVFSLPIVLNTQTFKV